MVAAALPQVPIAPENPAYLPRSPAVVLGFMGDLFPVFQPIVPLPWHRPQSDVIYEMLARIRTKEGLVLLPGEFLGSRVETYVVDTLMLRLIPEILDAHPKAHFSFNAAPSTLANTSYFDQLEAMLKANELITDRLILEITEEPGDPLLDVEVMERADQARSLGLRLALDDFGTGGNGIARLASTHFDMVKISPALDLGTQRGRTIVEGMIQLAGSLSGISGSQMTLVVEGIERADQLEQAMFINAHYGQGHIISPPVDEVIPAQKLHNRIHWISADYIRVL